MEHQWALLETRQWPSGDGHTATEKCKVCGLVVRTRFPYSAILIKRVDDHGDDRPDPRGSNCKGSRDVGNTRTT